MIHFDEFEIADVPEELPGFVFQAEFAQAVTGIVVGDFRREPRADVGDAEFSDEEFAELESVGGDRCGRAEELGIIVPHHRGAGTGWTDDRVVAVKNFQIALGEFAGFGPVAGIKGRLAATSLFRRELSGNFEPSQDSHHCFADFGIKLVNETWNE